MAIRPYLILQALLPANEGRDIIFAVIGEFADDGADFYDIGTPLSRIMGSLPGNCLLHRGGLGMRRRRRRCRGGAVMHQCRPHLARCAFLRGFSHKPGGDDRYLNFFSHIVVN